MPRMTHVWLSYYSPTSSYPTLTQNFTMSANSLPKNADGSYMTPEEIRVRDEEGHKAYWARIALAIDEAAAYKAAVAAADAAAAAAGAPASSSSTIVLPAKDKGLLNKSNASKLLVILKDHPEAFEQGTRRARKWAVIVKLKKVREVFFNIHNQSVTSLRDAMTNAKL